ncbi:MAG TPA: ribokinase [Saprospirales bacterium]|nr:ribokinase [Saprospirales bacterium]HAY72162.1 ribokinase [Saprospirales bacterium]HRQ31201.1 ribokinase [Saprospiraceae bacterium]
MERKRNKIVVIGSVNTDMIIKSARLPKPGETILGGVFSIVQGGKGANQAVAAAKAGGNTTFIARVGDDGFGETAINSYQLAGICTDFIIKDKTFPTGVALINVSEQGENSISVASGANAMLSVEDITACRDSIRSAGILLMQLETPIDTIHFAAGLAKSNNVTVILNPAPAQKLPDNLLAQVDILTPNETETEILTGILPDTEENIKKACDLLREKGIKTIIITLGAKGVYHSEIGFVKGFRVDAIDTTAAGDVFNGAFAVALSQGKGHLESIVFANAAAALSVQKLGAQSSIPSISEIDKFIMEWEN